MNYESCEYKPIQSVHTIAQLTSSIALILFNIQNTNPIWGQLGDFGNQVAHKLKEDHLQEEGSNNSQSNHAHDRVIDH